MARPACAGQSFAGSCVPTPSLVPKGHSLARVACGGRRTGRYAPSRGINATPRFSVPRIWASEAGHMQLAAEAFGRRLRRTRLGETEHADHPTYLL